MDKVVLVGAGGYFSGVVDSINKMGCYEIVGVTDPIDKVETFGVKVLGNDDVLEDVFKSGVKYAFITVGSIGTPTIRERLVKKVTSIGYKFINVIDPSAQISSFVDIGKMCYVGKNAVINSGVKIGDYCIIDSGSIVEHGCTLFDHVHIAPGAAVAGDVSIGYASHIGLNASILQGKIIGSRVIVGAGSTVIGNISDNKTVYGIVKEDKK